MINIKSILKNTTSLMLSGAMMLTSVPVNAITQDDLTTEYLTDMMNTQDSDQNTEFEPGSAYFVFSSNGEEIPVNADMTGSFKAVEDITDSEEYDLTDYIPEAVYFDGENEQQAVVTSNVGDTYTISESEEQFSVTYTAEYEDKIAFVTRDFDVSMVDESMLSEVSTLANETSEANANNITSIDSFSIQMASGAKLTDGKYVWNTVTNTSDHKFIYRINYATSGLKDIPVNTIKIRIPGKLLKNRAGEYDDYIEMSVPRKDLETASNPIDETDEDSEYAYYYDGDDIIIYNCKEVPAAQNGDFEVAYVTKDKTYEYVDMGKSDNFQAVITAGSNTKTSEPIPVYIDTHAVIESTLKYYPTLARSWSASWGTKPADADNYYYLPWTVKTNVEHVTTSKYNFTLDDVIKTAVGTTADGKTTDIKNKIEVVGYTVATTTYSKTNTQENQISEERYDAVLTRFPKSIFNDYTTITVTNSVTATVDPVDQVDPDTTATSERTWSWTKPVFTTPTGRFMIWKWGNENWERAFGEYYAEHKEGDWDFASYSLQRLQEAGKSTSVDHIGTDNKTGDLKYVVEAVGYPFPWTLAESSNDAALPGASSDDPYDYGHKNVTYQITDDTLYLVKDDSNLFVKEDYDPDNVSLGNGGVLLTADDYDFESIDFQVTMRDAERGNDGYPVLDDFTKDFNIKNHTYTNKDVLTFLVKVNGSWITAGTYNLGTKASTISDPHIKEIVNGKVTFDAGVDGYRVLTTNNYYRTYFFITPHVCLNRTSNVLSITGTNESVMQVLLKNVDTLNVYQGDVDAAFTNHTDTDEIVEISKVTGDRLKRTEKSSNIEKEVASISNNVRKKYCTIGWKVSQQEYAIEGSGEKTSITQQSGIFYDLMPIGSNFIKDSVMVKSGDTTLAENEYTVSTIQNYRNSGRTMLVVKINTSAKGYDMYYSSSHSWESLADYGKDVLNTVAYETGNEDIANGYPDDPADTQGIEDKKAALSSDAERALFKDLDDTTNDEKFIYSDASHLLDEVTAAQAGLKKQVIAEGDTNYSYETETTINGKYTYRMRFANTYTAQAKDLILFDSIENYNRDKINTSGGDSKWYGTLTGINTAQMSEAGAAPVVYYSTVANLDLDIANAGNHDISNTAIWHRLTDTTDLSTVKAVAIDIRKTADGSDFVLDPGKSVAAYLYMQAPANVVCAKGKMPETYNNIYAQNTIIDPFGKETAFYIHQDYTILRYLVKAPISIRKVSAEDENTVVPDMEFTLSGTSDYGTTVEMKQITDKNGYLTFTEVPAGTYVLQETASNDDWVLNSAKHEVIVDNTGHVMIDGTEYTNKSGVDAFVIKNTPRVHTDIEFTKRQYSSTTPLSTTISNAVFELSGTSDYGTKILQTEKSDENGIINFSNIEMGTYKLREIGNPDPQHLIENKNTYTVKIDKAALITITVDDKENGIPTYTDMQGNISIYDEAYHSFKLTKKSSFDNAVVKGAKFKLTGTSDYGTPVNIERSSNEAGSIEFAQLEPGSYILQEIQTGIVTRIDEATNQPYINDKFVLDDTKRIVVVNKDNTVTIDGLENSDSSFKVTNTEIPNGTVSITKSWSDGVHAKDDLPQLHITADINKLPKTYATLAVYDYSDSKTSPQTKSLKNFIGTTITTFEPYHETSDTPITLNEVLNKTGVTKIDDGTTKYSIYAWYETGTDGQKHAYWWSNAEVCYFPQNSQKMFDSCSSLTSLDISGFDTSKVTDMYYMFDSCSSLTSLDISGFDTSKVTDMSHMFASCASLTSLDISGFDTSKVTDMNYMFYQCAKLKNLDVSGFDTSKVTNMYYMFYNCLALTSLDVSGFDTGKVMNMSYMFASCSSLTSLDVSGFNTSQVTGMGNMFYNCSKLTNLDVSGFDTGKVMNMSYMFASCSSLTSLDVSGFNTSQVTGMGNMFYNCSKLTNLDVSGFDTGKVMNMSYMFYNCKSLTSLDVSGFNTSQVTNMNSMFSNCSTLTSLDVSGFNTSQVTGMGNMFYNCSKLTNLDVSGFNTSQVTGMGTMFYNCSKLTNLDVSGFNTSQVTNMKSMFSSCTSLTSLDVSGFNTSQVTGMGNMFYNCSKLTNLDVSGFDTSQVTGMGNMFYNCSKLTNLDVSGFDTSQVTNMNSMFSSCSSLTSLDVSGFDTSKVTNMYYMFYKCKSLTSLDVSGFNTSQVTNMNSMFSSCSTLTSLDVSGFDTGKVMNMSYMFSTCPALTSLDVSGFDTSNVTDMNYMFYGCAKLKNLDASSFDTSNVTSMGSMFSNCPALTSLDVSGFDTGKVMNMSYMFSTCPALTSLDISSFDTSKVTDISYMFYQCAKLKIIYVGSGWNISNAITTYMFLNCGTNTVTQKPSARAYSINNVLAMIMPVTKVYAAELTDDIKRMQVYDSITANVAEGTDDQQAALIEQFMTPNADNNAGYWKQNDDGTWTYTFVVFDPTLTYYGWEDVPENSIYDPDYAPAKYFEFTKAGNIINKGPEEEKPNVGSITITKTVRIPAGTTAPDKTFEFIIRLFTKQGDSKQPVTGSVIYGDTAFINGIAHVALKDGESITIPDIPAGYEYEIIESDMAGYSHVTPALQTGQIVANETAEVNYINQKLQYPPVSSGEFNLHKDVIGRYEGTPEFPITVQFSGIDPGTEIAVRCGTTTSRMTTDEKNCLYINVRNNETYNFSEIPEGTYYTVFEEGGSWISSYKVLQDGNLLESKSNTVAGQSITTGVQTINHETPLDIKLTNRITQTSPLHLKKTVDGDDRGTSYKVNVHMTGLDPEDVITSSIGKLIADDEGVIDIDAIVKNGTVIDFNDIPIGTKVTMIELKNSARSSYVITASDGTTVEQKDNATSQTDLTTSEMTIRSNTNNMVEFINHVNVTEASIKLIKTSADGKFFLQGAEYKLLKKDNNGEYVPVVQNDTEIVLVTKDNGTTAQVDHLTVGDYRLHEIKAPSGYGLKDVDFTLTEEDFGTVKTIQATDNKLSVLPETGSNGQVVFFLISVMLIAVGYHMVFRKKKYQLFK